MVTVGYGALKVPFFRIAELYFKTDYIKRCRLNMCLFQNIMVNEFTCNHIVRGDS